MATNPSLAGLQPLVGLEEGLFSAVFLADRERPSVSVSVAQMSSAGGNRHTSTAGVVGHNTARSGAKTVNGPKGDDSNVNAPPEHVLPFGRRPVLDEVAAAQKPRPSAPSAPASSVAWLAQRSVGAGGRCARPGRTQADAMRAWSGGAPSPWQGHRSGFSSSEGTGFSPTTTGCTGAVTADGGQPGGRPVRGRLCLAPHRLQLTPSRAPHDNLGLSRAGTDPVVAQPVR